MRGDSRPGHTNEPGMSLKFFCFLFFWLWDIFHWWEFQGKYRDNCVGKAENRDTVG